MSEAAATSWQVRAATQDDAAGLAMLPLGEEIASRSMQAWRAWLKEPATLTLVAAASDGGISGFLDVRHAADEAEIIDLWVAPPDRRKGVAAALLDRLCLDVANKGASRLFLEVAVDNAAACALYEKQGFATVARRNAYYTRPGSKPVDALVMARPIEGS